LIGAEFLEIDNVLQNISSKGLFISTSCETQYDADLLLKNAKKYCK
jgi:hypothetical protein